jgi:predicted Zn-dependent protease
VSNWGRYSGPVGSAISTFAAVTDRAVLDVQPLRIRVVTLAEATSLNGYHQRNGGPIGVDALARLNRTSAGAVLSGGTRIKTVVGRPIN